MIDSLVDSLNDAELDTEKKLEANIDGLRELRSILEGRNPVRDSYKEASKDKRNQESTYSLLWKELFLQSDDPETLQEIVQIESNQEWWVQFNRNLRITNKEGIKFPTELRDKIKEHPNLTIEKAIEAIPQIGPTE